MSLLDGILGALEVYANGVLKATRRAVNFVGIEVVDNPGTGRIDITFAGNALQIQGVPIEETAPAENDVLTFSGDSWLPRSSSGGLIPTTLQVTSYNANVGELVRAQGTLSVFLPGGASDGSRIGVVNVYGDVVTVSYAGGINSGTTFPITALWSYVELTYSSADSDDRWIVTSYYGGPGS